MGDVKEMKKACLALAMSAVAVFTAFANGQKEAAYPEKAITMIIPYGAGGTTDIHGRQFAIQLQKQLGKPVTVVNQGGASGSKGCKTVLDAAPDGYTVLFTAESLGTQRVVGLSEMSYNDFAPIMAVTNDPKVIVVGKDSKYKTLQDLLDDMKANPGKIKMSYTGPGGSGHVQGLVMEKLGYKPAYTAYSGGADCILAVLSKQVDFTNSNYSTIVGYLKSGDLRLLAVSGATRLPSYPDIPTFGEVDKNAVPYMKNAFTPLKFLVSKNVPADIQKILRQAALKAVKDPEWVKFVNDNCAEKLYEAYPEIEDINKYYKDWESMVSWMLYDAGVAKFSPEKFGIAKPAQ